MRSNLTQKSSNPLRTSRDTRIWDVRTKSVTHNSVPTIDDVLSIAAHGPSGTLFTIGRSYSVQQYDVVSEETPLMVKNVQHAPPNAPPTPPDSIEESKLARTVPRTILADEPLYTTHSDVESSEEEYMALSPLQKIVQDRSEITDESRDQLGPLSPISSRSSHRSASSTGRRARQRTRTEMQPSVIDESAFSAFTSIRSSCDSPSIRSDHSQRQVPPALRREFVRASVDEMTASTVKLDLFPFLKARMRDLKFRPPHYGNASLTPSVLREEMISVVFGWDADVETLIRDEREFASTY